VRERERERETEREREQQDVEMEGYAVLNQSTADDKNQSAALI